MNIKEKENEKKRQFSIFRQSKWMAKINVPESQGSNILKTRRKDKQGKKERKFMAILDTRKN